MVAHDPGQPVPAQLIQRLCTVQPTCRLYHDGSFQDAGAKVWLETHRAEELEHRGVVAIDEHPEVSVTVKTVKSSSKNKE